MLRCAVISVAMVAATSLPVASLAATKASAQPAAVPSSEAGVTVQASDPDPVKCKTITPTGSRLGGKKYCMRVSEWDNIRREAQEDTVDRQQNSRTAPVN